MTDKLPRNTDPKRREVYELADALLNRTITAEQSERLGRLVRGDEEARRHYVRFMHESAMLCQWGRDSLCSEQMFHEGQGARDEGRGMAGSPAIEEGSGFGIRGSENFSSKSQIPNQHIFYPESPAPPIILDLSLTSHYPLATSHYFVGGPVFSYMVATVILCAMLLGAWAYKITHYQHPQLAGGTSRSEKALEFVGQITGMVDCRWADPNTETINGASVPLGRRYALASGLMEITYKAGAKVILEGPCTYNVESRAGGFLSLGKLTARVEADRETRRQGDKEKRKQTIQRSLPFSPSPPLLFSVRTPTAIVIDLGTEFGVEVARNGDTTSHVFRGSVKVEVADSDRKQEVVLGESESARVEKGKDADGPRLVLSEGIDVLPHFVRRLVEPPKILDLLDVVAGGNGTGSRRERGIDPTTGYQDTCFTRNQLRYEHRYHPVTWHQMIDGVFIPDGRAGAVQLDSAGHMFSDFGHLTEGMTSGNIWARAADISSYDKNRDRWDWIYSMGRGDEFMPEGRGLLAFCADKGLTFDLRAIRKVHDGVWPARFRATTGIADASVAYPDPFGKADVWVFVDGRLKWKRRLLHDEAPVGIEVELGTSDRFLTLLSTNAGNGASCDWVVFGDPVLEMKSTEATEQKEERPMGK